MPVEAAPTESPLWSFAKRALIATAIVAMAYFLWRIRHTLLLAFAAIILAVLLLALAELIQRLISIAHRWAVMLAVVILLVALVGLGWLVGAQVQSKFAQLWQQLPQGIEALEEQLGMQLIGNGQNPASPGAAGESGRGQTGGPALSGSFGSRLLGQVTSYLGTAADAVVSLILVVISGVFLAAEPGLYRRGTARLFPRSEQDLASETMADMGRALRLWLVGKLISMLIVGMLAGLGTWWLGLPAPIALGIFAGLTEFVAVVGPIIGAIPAVVLAATEGGSTLLWTVLLFLAIQQLESHFIAPVVQERMVSLPPALFVLAIAAFGAMFGILGVIVATPLLVAVYVAVQKLWIGEALHQEQLLPGDKSGSD